MSLTALPIPVCARKPHLFSPLRNFGNFGGPTNTLQLLPGSPAIGQGDPAGPPTDQRGVFRSPAAPSIGAFEFTG